MINNMSLWRQNFQKYDMLNAVANANVLAKPLGAIH